MHERKKISKSVSIWRRYGQLQSGTFFGTQCSFCYRFLGGIAVANVISDSAHSHRIAWFVYLCVRHL